MMHSRDIDRVAPAKDHEALSSWAEKRGDMNKVILEGQKDRAWITPIYMFCIACFVVWQLIMWGPF